VTRVIQEATSFSGILLSPTTYIIIMTTKNERDLVELLSLEERRELVGTVSEYSVFLEVHSEWFYRFITPS
jgi:hypothetical protein